jgi:hypothetical protein
MVALGYFSSALFSHHVHRVYAQETNTTAKEQQEKTNKPTENTTVKNDTNENDTNKKDDNNENSDSAATTTITNIDRSTIEIAEPIDALQLKKDDLVHYSSTEQVVPLLAGPEEYLTVISTNSLARSKGVMILLPDWQQSASSPKALNYLHQTLPSQGWTSIKVQPANKPHNYPSTALTLAARAQENDKTLSEYQRRLALLIDAVTTKASTYPGIIVIVAQGHNASLAVNIFQQTETKKPTALIMLSSFLDDNKNNQTVAINLSQLALPILDLYLQRDHPSVLPSARLRKKHVNHQLKVNFRQKSLFNTTTGYYTRPQLVKEINGWLKYLGW